mgnify:CR=1 FL=1
MYIQNRDAGRTRSLYTAATDRQIRGQYCGLAYEFVVSSARAKGRNFGMSVKKNDH